MSQMLKIPDFISETKDFKQWKADLEMWGRVCNLKDEQKAEWVVLHLEGHPSGIKDKIMTSIPDSLNKADGLASLITFVEGVYKEDDFTEAYENYMDFEDIKRGEKETIKMFLPRWDMALAKIKKTDCVIPDMILAFKLLKAINIEQIDMSIVTTGIDFEEGKSKKNLQDQARAAIKKYAGKSILKESDISASHDGSMKVWDVDSGSCLHTLLGHTGGVTFLQMHGNIAVSGSCDTNTLRVWDVREGICLRTLRHCSRFNERVREYNRVGGHILMLREDEDSERVRHVQFDGRFVVSGIEEKTIKIWDPETGACLRTLSHHYSIVFLKLKGDDVVAGYDDGSIKVWEVNTGVCRHTLRVNCSQYMELQGDTLVCDGEDRTTAKIWNLSTGACLHTLNAHRRAISGIGVNDKLVVTSSRDGTVKLWDIKTGEFIRDMLVLESGGSVEKMKIEDAKIVCVVKSNETSKLLVLNFDTIDSTQ